MKFKYTVAAFALLSICGSAIADIDQSVFTPRISNIGGFDDSTFSAQTFTAGMSGQLNRLDVSLAGQYPYFPSSPFVQGTTRLYVMSADSLESFDLLTSAYISLPNSLVGDGGYASSSLVPSQLVGFDTSSLSFNVVAGNKYAFVLAADYHFLPTTDNFYGPFLQLGCTSSYNCNDGSDGTDFYQGGEYVGGFIENGRLKVNPFAYILDASFRTYVGYAPEIDYSNVSAIPEPETYALMLAGLALVGAIPRRRKQKAVVA